MQYTRIRPLVERLRAPRAIALLAMCLILIATSGAFAIVQLRSQRGEAAGLQALTLPGQQRWMQAGTPVSSYLFGTTDLGQEGVSPNIETSRHLAQIIATHEFYGLGDEEINQLEARVDGVTPEIARQVTQRHFPAENLVFVLIGKSCLTPISTTTCMER